MHEIHLFHLCTSLHSLKIMFNLVSVNIFVEWFQTECQTCCQSKLSNPILHTPIMPLYLKREREKAKKPRARLNCSGIALPCQITIRADEKNSKIARFHWHYNSRIFSAVLPQLTFNICLCLVLFCTLYLFYCAVSLRLIVIVSSVCFNSFSPL